MNLKRLRDLVECDLDVEVCGVADDSRNVEKGFLYVATKGYNVDHYDYIDKAIEAGCSCVVADRDVPYDIPYVVVENINDLFYEICEKYYDVNPSDFNFVGITGTDGKTTTAYIVKEILSRKEKTTYIGTLGALIDDLSMDIHNTTPIVSELYDVLRWSKNNNSFNVVMEVSSEALLHKRVKRFKYKVAGITNITEDHLNVHKTMENYISCKKSLLDFLADDGFAIVNGDDNNCKDIVSNNLVTFGFDKSNMCTINIVDESLEGTLFDINYLGKTYRISTPLVARYNVYNVTMAFLICYHLGLDTDYIIDTISTVKIISGRRERLEFGQDFEIILDYAHTLNGIQKVIESVPKDRDIIVVTGAAGGREKSKRRKIGKYILDNCNTAIFTMDDPRYESVDQIIDQMVEDSDKDYIRIIDRVEAIHKAFDIAKPNSTVLILGKGRDTYMAIEDRKDYYCDYDTISDYFNKR